MNGMRGEAGTPGADPAMPAGPAAASAGADATAGGVTTSSAVQLIAERIASEAGSEVARASQSNQTAFFAQTLLSAEGAAHPAAAGRSRRRDGAHVAEGEDAADRLGGQPRRYRSTPPTGQGGAVVPAAIRGLSVEGMDVRIADPGAPAAQTATGGARRPADAGGRAARLQSRGCSFAGREAGRWDTAAIRLAMNAMGTMVRLVSLLAAAAAFMSSSPAAGGAREEALRARDGQCFIQARRAARHAVCGRPDRDGQGRFPASLCAQYRGPGLLRQNQGGGAGPVRGARVRPAPS